MVRADFDGKLGEGFEAGVQNNCRDFAFVVELLVGEVFTVFQGCGRTHRPSPQHIFLYFKFPLQYLYDSSNVMLFISSEGNRVAFRIAASTEIKTAKRNPHLKYHIDIGRA